MCQCSFFLFFQTNLQQGMMGQPMMGQAPLTGVPPTMTAAPMVMQTNPAAAAGLMQATQSQVTMQAMMQTNGGNKSVPLDPFGAL